MRVHQRYCVPGKSKNLTGTEAQDCSCSSEGNTRNAHKHMASDDYRLAVVRAAYGSH